MMRQIPMETECGKKMSSRSDRYIQSVISVCFNFLFELQYIKPVYLSYCKIRLVAFPITSERIGLSIPRRYRQSIDFYHPSIL
jgi:hypothetical protein